MSQLNEIEVNGKVYSLEGGGGTTVIPNPELSGDENTLESIQIGTDKFKVEGEEQVQSNWAETNTESKSFIQNKPSDLVHISKDSTEVIIKDSQMVISPFPLAIDEETGEYGYIKKVEGADTFFPFKSGGGIEKTTLMTNGQISDTRQYLYPSFDNLELNVKDYDILEWNINFDGEEIIVYTSAVTAKSKETQPYSIYLEPRNSNMTVQITANKVLSVAYSGSYVNIFVTLKGIKL